MAKRKHARRTRTIDTGIIVKTIAPLDWDSMTASCEQFRRSMDWDHVVSGARELAEWVIARDQSDDWPAEIGNREASVSDARSLLIHLRKYDDPQLQLAHAFYAGRLYERLYYIRPAEPSAMTGRNCRSGAARGGQAKRLSDEERKTRAADFREAMKDIRKRHPQLKLAAVKQRIADRFGVSYRTVERYLRQGK